MVNIIIGNNQPKPCDCGCTVLKQVMIPNVLDKRICTVIYCSSCYLSADVGKGDNFIVATENAIYNWNEKMSRLNTMHNIECNHSCNQKRVLSEEQKREELEQEIRHLRRIEEERRTNEELRRIYGDEFPSGISTY